MNRNENAAIFGGQTRFDAVVIGAGLGGLSAAISLRECGLRVALLERGEVGRHKVCGEFLSPESGDFLRNLGVYDAVFAAGATQIRRARVALGEKIGRELPLLPNRGGEAGIGISRAQLDAILWERAAKIGVQTRQNTRVLSWETDAENFRVSGQNFELTAPFLVAATGRGAWILPSREKMSGQGAAKFLGLKAHFSGVGIADDEVQLFPFRGGYCGISRVENGAFNVCALVDYRRAKGRSSSQIFEEMSAENAAFARAMNGATPRFEWLATGNVSFGNFRPAHEGILCVGDAAGYIHPLAGDGMAMALRAGQLAAHAISSSEKCDVAAQLYAQNWRREFGARLKWAARLQPLMLRPKWALRGLQMLDCAPILGKKLVALTRG